jgi:hypothetical protein
MAFNELDGIILHFALNGPSPQNPIGRVMRGPMQMFSATPDAAKPNWRAARYPQILRISVVSLNFSGSVRPLCWLIHEAGSRFLSDIHDTHDCLQAI